MHADLSFSIHTNRPIPSDHGYLLFAALTDAVPLIRTTEEIGVHPIRGRQIGGRQIMIADWSRLTLRTPIELVHVWMPLAGKLLRIGNVLLRVGVPTIFPLRDASSLRSRLVTIKGATDSDAFIASARQTLNALEISERAKITIPVRLHASENANEAHALIRRTINIKGRQIIGYELHVDGLTGEESLRLQVNGIGGRRHMGCGVFTPFRESAH